MQKYNKYLFCKLIQNKNYQFMRKHFELISTQKQINNGTFAFIVKPQYNSYGEDKVLVIYQSGYVRGSVYNPVTKKMGIRKAQFEYAPGYVINFDAKPYHVIERFDENDVIERYNLMFARMRAYVTKHKLI